MAKTKVSQFDATASNNTDINSVNVAEGCPPSGINNAIREMASLLKKQEVGTDPMTSPDINGGTIDGATIGASSASTGAFTNLSASGTFTSRGIDDNADATAITIDSAENVAIGKSVPLSKLDVTGGFITVSKDANTAGRIGASEYITGSTANDLIIQATGSAITRFYQSGVNSLNIDSSGRMLLGTTTEGQATADDLTVATSSHTGITIRSGTTNEGNVFFSDGTSGDDEYRGYVQYRHNDNSMRFGTNAVTRMTIDSSGRLGCTSHVDMGGILIYSAMGSNGIAIQTTASGNHAYIAYKFRDNSGQEVGNIQVNTTSTTFNTSSDYRLKENVNYSFDATSRLKQLKPARFNFIKDSDTTVDGFIAHEVSSIVPEAITGAKDATESIANVVLNADGTRLTDDVTQEKWVAGKLSTTDEDGNTVEPIYASDTTWVASQTVPKYQSIDQAKLVPLLVKTIQELEARITALEGA